MAKNGIVYLVGAGPGRPDLITVRGLELLRSADCIVCDKLSSPALLGYARQDAEIIPVHKRAGPGSATQDQINRLIVQAAQSGKTVVRLKGGDPTIFGRLAEELAVLIEAGIDFEIVPGVTAALGASAYSGILLTDRASSSQVVLVTGHEAEGKTASSIPWPDLARFQGTIVFYMGVTRLCLIADNLISHGMDGRMPCAVVADATLPTQRTLRARLDCLADRCRQEGLEPPAVVIVGPVAAEGDRLDWFDRLPLFGKTVVATRDGLGNVEFAGRLAAYGANALSYATIRLKALTESSAFLEALSRLQQYHWVVFSSARGVDYFFEALDRLAKDSRSLAGARVAAIGPATSQRLRSFGIRTDLVPPEFTSSQLAGQLLRQTSLAGQAVLLLRSELADDDLRGQLASAGAAVDQIAVYTAEPTGDSAKAVVEQMQQGKVHWLTFASGSEARAFFDQVPAGLLDTGPTRVASIGPVTSAQLRRLGARVDIEAQVHTLEGIIQAMIGVRP